MHPMYRRAPPGGGPQGSRSYCGNVSDVLQDRTRFSRLANSHGEAPVDTELTTEVDEMAVAVPSCDSLCAAGRPVVALELVVGLLDRHMGQPCCVAR